MSLVKCVYPDWEGGYTEGEHFFGNDDTCVVCGEPKANVPSNAEEAPSPRQGQDVAREETPKDTLDARSGQKSPAGQNG